MTQGVHTGLVLIGRNEEQRLESVLSSVTAYLPHVVYVDSGSTDRSLQMAQAAGLITHALSAERPFSAARARNEGASVLLKRFEHLKFIQFLDGDSELAQGWVESAEQYMSKNPDVGVLCGRVGEISPHGSIYNRIAELEWQQISPGTVRSCGGNRFVDVEAFSKVGGYDERMVAGEDPELCYRMRQAGYRSVALSESMAIHDMDMTRFFDWWKRSVRTGVGNELGFRIHGRGPERFRLRQVSRAWIWGLTVPVLALFGSAVLHPSFLLILAVYPLRIIRVAFRGQMRGLDNWRFAALVVLANFAEMVGQLKALFHDVSRTQDAVPRAPQSQNEGHASPRSRGKPMIE